MATLGARTPAVPPFVRWPVSDIKASNVRSQSLFTRELEPVGVIGVGWVGLVTAACFAELGHEVWARDVLQDKVEALSRGEVRIHEPGLPELVARNAERLHFTTDMGDVLKRARLLFCCVDTPPTHSGDADLSRVEAVLAELGDADALERLYSPLGSPTIRTDVASAEMIKLASNAFLATKISFINEIANVSEELGADVSEVARGMGLDDRIGPKFLQAGLGYGGSCFPKDVSALKQLAGNSGYHFQLLNSVIEVNELQKRRVVQKLQKHLGRLRGKTVALLGLAFKPNTDDMREAPSIVLASRLLAEGAEVTAWDPVAHPGEAMKGVTIAGSPLAGLPETAEPHREPAA